MSNVPMTLPDLAISNKIRPFGHTSTFVELDDGRIFHASKRVCEYSEDGGLTWSKTTFMEDIKGNPVGGQETSLVKLNGTNEVGLAARLHEDTSDWPYAAPRSNYGFWFWRSADAGQTWQEPIRMTAPGLTTAGYQDVFLRTSSGRIVLPVFLHAGQSSGPNDKQEPMSGRLVNNQWISTAGHYFDASFSAPFVVYSDDDGRTWNMNKDGAIINLLDWNAIYSYGNESSITEVTPGRLLLFMRNGLGRIFQAWSNDNGETWTRPQATSLASPTAPAQIRTLPNGHLLCVWNQAGEDEIKKGYNRTRLSSAISRNGGSVWEFFQNVESIHETTRVEPGPIQPTRPEEISFLPGHPAPERNPDHILQSAIKQGLSLNHCYPSVLVMKDRVLVVHTFNPLKEHPTEARLIREIQGEAYIDEKNGKYVGSKWKILPLKWFYGGKEPADNTFLKTAYEPAKP